MRVLLSFVLLLLATSAHALDREAFTITRYDLDLRVEPSQQRLGVRGRITLRNDSPSPQRQISLQISSSLNWRSIRWQKKADVGERVQFLTQPYTSDIDHTGVLSEAIVTLPQEVAPKASVDLMIGYEGVIVLDPTRLIRLGTPDSAARHSDWDQIGKTFTAVRGVGYATWYPVAMEAQSLAGDRAMFAALGKWKARHADSQMKLRMELVSSGAEKPKLLLNGEGCVQSEDAASNSVILSGCKFSHMGQTNPVFLAGDFSASTAGPVRLQVLPEHSVMADDFGKLGDRAALLVKDWFGDWFKDWSGPAHEQPVVVDLADSDAAPFEAGDWLLLPLGKADAQMERELLIHQLTHSAFPSPSLWMFEGAAHFAQAVAVESGGREAALAFLQPQREAVALAEKQAGSREPLGVATQEVLYRGKAVLVWWMLRDMLGDVAFKRALNTYRAGDDTDVTYFERLLEAESKRDLAWFFHDWVYTDAGLPDLKIETANARLTHGTSYITAVSVANRGGAGAEVVVTVHTDAGDFAQRLEIRSKSEAVTRIPTPAEPVEVIVNDGSVPEVGESVHRFKIAAGGG